ncbi:hypothetical protein SDC9_166409 [bioreactor metagenome]|uniref:Uncharacterized protein n=1 Tax=bioreactor metagenome TaxID=1076179 RepID=A0A645G4U2_9ZZZZ
MFAVNENQSFLSVVFQRFNFFYQFVVRECFADGIFVRSLKSAVSAVVRALIAYVKRSKEYDAVSVNFFLKFPGALFDELHRP